MRKNAALLAIPLTLALMGGTAWAAGQSTDGTVKMNSSTGSAAGTTTNSSGAAVDNNMTTGATSNNAATNANANASANAGANKGDVADARDIVNGAVRVVDQMKQDQNVANLLRKAKGVYIVPDFGRGGFIVGGRGGAGVMLARHNGHWTDPAFFNFGGVSIGAQAGGSGGAVAFILMTPNAVDAFRNGSQFSLNSGAGISIVNYSANAQASVGKGDIVFWSNTSGAYAGATVSVSDIGWASGNNQGYYGKNVSPTQLIDGQVAMQKGRKLKSALPG